VHRAALASAADRTLTWFDRTGKALGTLGAPGLYNNVALSPDGIRAVVVQGGPQRTDLWVAEPRAGCSPDSLLVSVQKTTPIRSGHRTVRESRSTDRRAQSS
jgi:hypothetical protein